MNNPFNNQGGGANPGNYFNNQSGNTNQGGFGGGGFGGFTQGQNQFNNNNQQGTGQGFGMQNNQGGNTFNNNNQGGNQFGNNQQGNTQGGVMFNNQNNNQGMMFNNQGNQNQGGMLNNQGQANQGGMFGQNQGNMSNNNQNQGGNAFGNQGNQGGMFNQGNQGGGMFNNTQNQGGNTFGNQGNQGGGMFNNNQNQGGNTFGNQGNQGGMFNNNQGGNAQGGMFNNQSNQSNQNNQNQSTFNYQNSFQYHQHIEMVRNQLEDCLKKIKQKTYEQKRLQYDNMFREKALKSLTKFQDILQGSVKVILRSEEIRKQINAIKEEQAKIEKKSQSFSKAMHQKLRLYKKCLIQSTTHHKMISQIKKQIDLMNKEMSDFFKPLLFAYQSKRTISVQQPNSFDLKISYSILGKLETLGQRVDDIITCQNQTEEETFNSTITVFEQLVEYYQNVACNFRDFQNAYNILKIQAIEKDNTTIAKDNTKKHEIVMGRVQKRCRQNLKEEYKYYNLIREIDEALGKRDSQYQNNKLQSSHNWRF